MSLSRWTRVLLFATVVTGTLAAFDVGGYGGVLRPVCLIYAALLGLVSLRLLF